ncbi:MAG TPA: hypothetical protein PLW50_01015 [Smithellaceae bacterium]|nr:hypothetical protein [Smithellaceae bacterium]
MDDVPLFDDDNLPLYKNKMTQAVLETFPNSKVVEVHDYITGKHYKTGIKGGSKMSKIDGLMPKEWSGKKFVEASIDGKVYSIWQNFDGLKVGDEVTGESIDKGAGKTPQYKLASINGVAVKSSGGGGGNWKGGGGTPQEKARAFATSYAKDVVVALISRGDGSTRELSLIKETFDYFYTIFHAKMDTPADEAKKQE